MRFSSSSLSLKNDYNNSYLLTVCCLASSAQFATGYELGAVNAVFFENTSTYTSIFIVMLLLGLTLGSLSVKFLSLRYGRRALLIVSACMLIVGTALVSFRQDIIHYDASNFIGQFICGFACGIGSTVAPIYSKA